MAVGRRGSEYTVRREHEDAMGTNVYSAKDNKSMHKSLNGEFILYQILLQRILDGKDLSNASNSALLNYFQPDKKKDKDIMSEFDTDYKSSKAIYWYTRESCIYRILNQALRKQNIDHIVPFRSFVKDLNTQLSEEHQVFIRKQETSTLQVYRGQLISKDELTRLKAAKSPLVSMNSFLSTSTNRKKALEFATSRPPPTDELTSVLLEITVNLNSLTRPFADIQHLSAFSEEAEILFMFGCVFRIDDIQYNEQLKLWMAKLTLCSEDDEDMKNVSSTLRDELKGQNSLIAIGTYFIHMLKFDDAEDHFEKIINNNLANDDIERAYCHHGLAQVNTKKGDHHLAIENVKQALNYLSKNPSFQDHPLLALCYNDLGLIYSNQANYTRAFEYFEKALKTINNDASITYSGLSNIHFKMTNYKIALEYLKRCLKEQPETNHALIANTYIDMGKVYAAMKDKEKASEMFDNAIQSQLKDLSPDHPDLGYTYSAIGLMYSDINDEAKAFEYIEKAYQIQTESLAKNHPDFGQSYKNFGDLYMKKGDLDKALFYYEKSLENQLKTLSTSHPSVADTYRTIGHVHWKKRDYDQALIYFHKVLESELARKKIGETSLSRACIDIGDLHVDKYNATRDTKNLDEALVYYLKYLDNEFENKFYEDFSLANMYKIIANISYKQRRLDQSLLYYNRLLDCHLRKPIQDRSGIDEVYIYIGKVYLKKRHFDQSILYYNKTENQSSPIKHKDIDNIHFEKRHLDQSLHHFEKDLEKQVETHSEKDPTLINTYHILANICFEKRNYDQALEYFLQLLDRTSPQDSSLFNVYKAIGTIYYELKNYNQSIIYFNILLDLQLQKKKTLEHRLIGDTYKMIGNIYLNKQVDSGFNKKTSKDKVKPKNIDSLFEKRHLDQALMYFQNLLNRLANKETFDDGYAILGYISLERQDFNQALTHFQTLLNMQLKKHPQGDASLAYTYLIMGNTYAKQGQSAKALENYKQSLLLYQRIDPENRSIGRKIEHKIRRLVRPAT